MIVVAHALSPPQAGVMGPPAPRQARHLWLQKGINAKTVSEKSAAPVRCLQCRIEDSLYQVLLDWSNQSKLEQMNELQRL
jgi:hypothetical protein